jgi:hypothetical protein
MTEIPKFPDNPVQCQVCDKESYPLMVCSGRWVCYDCYSKFMALKKKSQNDLWEQIK